MQYFRLIINSNSKRIFSNYDDVRSLVRLISHNINDSSLSPENTIGKIPKEWQYTPSPEYSDLKNRITLNILTALNCDLSSDITSSLFGERAKIIRTWTKSLPESSIWEFNLTHRLGDGISLNKVYDIISQDKKSSILLSDVENALDNLKESKDLKTTLKDLATIKTIIKDRFTYKKKSHPSSYVFLLEIIGDRRASIKRKADDDIFVGFGPSTVRFEFETSIKYLVNQKKLNEIVTYTQKVIDRDFDDEEWKNEFHPDRELSFNVHFNDIGAKKPYELLYDNLIDTGSSSVLEQLQKKFEEYGFDKSKVTEDDKDLNINKPPSEPSDPNEYGGPDAPPPYLR